MIVRDAEGQQAAPPHARVGTFSIIFHYVRVIKTPRVLHCLGGFDILIFLDNVFYGPFKNHDFQ